MKVIIIGCGPAGLAAAHAAAGLGANVEIIAPKLQTPQRGPLLIQRAIPGINTSHPDGTIHQFVVGGSILDYRYKLYGDINIGINGDKLVRRYHAWRHDSTYDKLWLLYNHLIDDRYVEPHKLAYMHEEADLVVSTANARAMCYNPSHDFTSKPVAIAPYTSFPNQPDNTLIFNAEQGVPWVRSSMVFGVPVTEWPVEQAPKGARIIQKPISTNCDCYPHVLRTGRFGAFKNETWIDTAYWDTFGAIDSMLRPIQMKNMEGMMLWMTRRGARYVPSSMTNGTSSARRTA